MTLRKKTLLIIGVMLIGLIAMLYAVSQTVFLDSFSKLEKQDTSQNVERALSAISDDISNLNAIVGDWAPWDDTYVFVEDLNQSYVQRNLSDETLANLGINFMLFINSSGQIVYGKAIDLQKEEEMPVPKGLEEYISASDHLASKFVEENRISGIILPSEGPMLIASCQILTSENKGPIHGALIVGRYLDSAGIDGLAETTRLSLTVYRLDEPQMPADFEAARSALTEDEAIFVSPLDSKSVAGYALIRDIYGAPVLVLRADMPRGIYQQGQASLLYFISLLVGVSLLFVMVVVVLLERSVLSPLSRLNASVREIGASENLSAQVAVGGRNEVSSLGGEINKMLKTLQRSREAQRESELVATATIEGMADGVMLVNMAGKVTYVNKAFEKLLRHKAEEIVGTSALELPTYRSSKDRERAREALKMLIEKGSAKAVDMTAITKDGEDIPISFNASLIKDAQGNPRTLVAVLRDVTERRWAEEVLRQSEEYFRALIENSQDAIVILDGDGTIRYESPSVGRLWGYKPEDWADRNYWEFVFPEDMQDVAEKFAKLLQNQGSSLFTNMRIRQKDGSMRVVEASGQNLLDNPAVKGIVLNIRDITERKRIEEALQQSELNYRVLFDSTLDGLFVVDSETMKVVLANESGMRMAKIYGFDSLTDLNIADMVEFFHPEDRDRVIKTIAEDMFEKDLRQINEFRMLTKDGREMWISAVGTRTKYQGKSAGLVSMRDITKRKQMEEELRRLSDAVKMTTDSVAVTDMRGRILDINEAGLRMYGLSDRADFVGRNPLDAIAPEDRRKALENMAKLVETGQVNNIEYHVLRKDGSKIFIETSVSVIKGGNGEPKGLVAVARDITESRKAAEALKQSEKKYRQLFEIMQEGLWLIDKDSITTFVNPRMAEILGYTAEEMLGKHLFEFMDERGTEAAKYGLERCRQGIRVQHDFEFTRKDGARVYASLETSPITDEAGNYVGALACVADITARKEVQEALQNSEEYFRSLIENAQDAIVIVAGDGTISYGSPAIERMLGYKPEELLSADALFGFAHPDDIPKVVDTFASFTENGSASVRIELRIRHKDGSWRVVEAVANNLLENRAIKGIVVNWRDVTERKKAEEALKESEERYRMLAENVKDVISAIDMNLRTTYMSPSVTQLTGYSVEEAMALTLEESLTPASYEKLMRVFDERMAAETRGEKGLPTSLVLEVEAKHKDGHLVSVEMRVNLLRDAEGKPVGILGVTRDITERKKAEEVLRLSEEKYRLVVDNANEVIVVAQDGMLKFFNSRTTVVLGYSKEELASKPFIEFVHPDDQQMVIKRYLERLSGGQPPSLYAFRVVGKDGNITWVEINAVVINWEGSPATLNFLTDVTERKRAEEEKQKMEEQLRLAGRLAAVGELAAGVAHELNNPLAAIQGYSQFLSSSNNLDVDTRKDVETIYREALRASKITQNLLSFARRHEPEKKFISLNEVIEKTVELRAHPLEVGNIELVTELAPDLPKTMADFYQLQQVFVNLINNAEQAMAAAHGKGKLVIKTQKSNGMIQVMFTDDGPGIPEENINRIFDPFFTTKEVGKGTGLGLSICYGIVEAHGGRIYAKSKVGEGATFIVEIPIVSEGQSTQEV
jgi:PAS domain S-box-containing protein